MCTLIGPHESGPGWSPPAKPLDEAVWDAWVMRGRAHDRRSSDARVKAAKWVSIAGLLAAAGMWSRLTVFEVVVRFIVAAGAIAVMLQALHARQYAVSALFGVLGLLFNPIAPIFNFSGDWQRALVIISAAPFAASLAWHKNEARAQ
jgi:hypothetical protein